MHVHRGAGQQISTNKSDWNSLVFVMTNVMTNVEMSLSYHGIEEKRADISAGAGGKQVHTLLAAFFL